MDVSSVFSASVTVSLYVNFTCVNADAYWHQSDSSGGFHVSGVWSLFDWFTLSVTAHSCGESRSFANASRSSIVHSDAPVRHASASGTMWSMSTSPVSVHVSPSYGLVQLPESGAQSEPTSTFSPSRF